MEIKKQTLRERNLATTLKVLRTGKEVVALNEALKRTAKKAGLGDVDMFDAKTFPVMENGFKWSEVRAKLQEADALSGFPQVARAGVQTIADSAYQTVSTTYEDWTTVVQSSKDTELYAPLHGIAFPQEVGRQEKYPEVGAAGLDISLTNRKYGTMFPVEMELYADDQTGQFSRQASLLGEYLKQMLEVLSYGKLASVANMKYSNFSVPPTETKPLDEVNGYPFATQAAPFVGGGYNRPATFTVIGQAAVQNAKIGLMNQKNKLGLKMSVDGNRLLVGPNQEFDARVLLNSTYYPSGASAAGAVGGAFSINPIQGLADLTVSRFIFNSDGTVDGTSKAWYLCDDSKPFFVVQLREAIAIEMENPQSGESFERDVVRYKARMRGNADYIDPRFIWQGNDGSVTS